MAGMSAQRDGEPRRWERLPGRILFSSHSIPPDASGQAIALGRLLGDADPRDYRLIGFDPMAFGHVAAQGSLPLPGRAFAHDAGWRDRAERTPPDRLRRLRHLRFATEVGAETLRTARILSETIADERCDALVAISGPLPRLPAAALAARMAGVPLFILMWDFWRYQFARPLIRRVVEQVEPAVLRQAAAVVAPNELLAADLRRLDGVEPRLIRIPVADEAQLGWEPERPRPPGAPFRLVYSGQIYAAMGTPIAALSVLLGQPSLSDIDLHLYTPQDNRVLEAWGVAGRHEHRGWVHPPEIYRVQRAADALFLPLAFDGPLADIIRTSSTTKLGDYLASGRPVIVQAPPDSYVSWFIRRRECGLAVDSPEPAAVVRAARLLRDDPALRERLGRRAVAVAREEFGVETARRRFREMLEDGLAAHRRGGRR